MTRRPPLRSPGTLGTARTCGKLSAASSGSAGRRFTRTSYQPACPVTGSELLMCPPAKGNSSVMRWFSKKPLRASSAPGASCHAPDALPIAFQVHTVPGSTASLWRTMQRSSPQALVTQAQPPSSIPAALAVTGFTCR